MKRLFRILKEFFKRNYFGFLSPYCHFNKSEKNRILGLIDNPDDNQILLFEKELGAYIGAGNVVSFGAGRMAFYSILKCWNIGKGDEVILTGFTCAVMANAVLRIGATPIFVDIDRNSLGLSVEDLKKKITSKTKVIVAQHSFGIPCDIDKIVNIAKERNIKLIEDCALTLGSSLNGIKCGNWGDAAIFSTDHTKPLNTLIGGFAYTKNGELFNSLKKVQENSMGFSDSHLRKIVDQYFIEEKLERLGHRFFYLNQITDALINKINKNRISPYLENDSSNCIEDAYYPYPAKYPAALAYIGRVSLSNYVKNSSIRRDILSRYIKILNESVIIPKSYFDPNKDIIPLRFAYMPFEPNNIEEKSFLDDWIWFKKPLISTNVDIRLLGYNNDCILSEKIGNMIMNLPIIMNIKQQQKIFKLITSIYK